MIRYHVCDSVPMTFHVANQDPTNVSPSPPTNPPQAIYHFRTDAQLHSSLAFPPGIWALYPWPP